MDKDFIKKEVEEMMAVMDKHKKAIKAHATKRRDELLKSEAPISDTQEELKLISDILHYCRGIDQFNNVTKVKLIKERLEKK